MKELMDSFNRQITYLRLSVTDRCQFKCTYCVPPQGVSHQASNLYLTPDEMELFVRSMAKCGVRKLRLTGGEPLLRKDILNLVARFSSIAEINDLALSTNGEYLENCAFKLKKLGLTGVNISLDSLDPARFYQLTGAHRLDKVWKGVHRAVEVGLKVKINVVALKGMSLEEIDRFAKLAFEHPLEVRFIEFMPLCGAGWKPELVLPIKIIRDRIHKQYQTQRQPRGSDVAESYQLIGGKGSIGYIASMTEPFCQNCSRIRMNAFGKIQLCLFSALQYNMRPLIRGGATKTEIGQEVQRVLLNKPKNHPYIGQKNFSKQPAHDLMQTIGG